jgi:hypothetical protein
VATAPRSAALVAIQIAAQLYVEDRALAI